MKKKRVLIIGLVLVLCLVFFVGVYAQAEGIKIEAVSDLLGDRYPISRYRSYISTKKGFFGLLAGDSFVNMMSGFCDLLFEGTKMLWQIFDFIVKELYTMNLLDKLNDIISTLTGNMWTLFQQNYVGIVLTFSLLYVVRTFFLESPKNAIIQFGKICLVLLVAGIWFPRSSEYMRGMNDASFVMQAEVMSIAGQADETSALASSGNGSIASNNEQATNIIRNELFTQVVFRPFLLLNYGTTNKDKINSYYAKTKNEDIKSNNGEYLLSKEFDSLEDDQKMAILDELAEENPTLTGDSIGYKFIISLLSLAGVFLYGIPITVISGLNMVLQLLAIVFSYILPIVALISLIPKYSNAFIGSLVNMAKIFMGKAFLGLLVLLFSLINLTIDLLIPPEGWVSAIVNTLVKGLIYWLSWKYKDKIIRAVVNTLTQRNGQNNFDFNMQQFNEGMNDFANGDMTPSLNAASNLDDIPVDLVLNMATEGMYGAVSDVSEEIDPQQETNEETNQEPTNDAMNEVEGEFTEIPNDADGSLNEIPIEPIDETIDVEDTEPIDVTATDSTDGLDGEISQSSDNKQNNQGNMEQSESKTNEMNTAGNATESTTDGQEQGAVRRTTPEPTSSQQANNHAQAPNTAQIIEQQIRVLNNQPINQTNNHQENNQVANVTNTMNNTRLEKHTHNNEFQQKLRVLRGA